MNLDTKLTKVSDIIDYIFIKSEQEKKIAFLKKKNPNKEQIMIFSIEGVMAIVNSIAVK